MKIQKDRMYLKFRLYGFLKNQRFFDPFIILFFREMGMSFLDIGILFSIREISTNILEIPTGFIADSFGRRRAMISAFSSYLLAFALFYLFPSFWIYAVAMVLYGSGEALRSGTHKAMILEYLRKNRMEHLKIEYYGHTRAASQFGSAISSLIAIGIVLYFQSYRPVFLISMIPYVLDLILMISYPKYLDGIEESREKEIFKRMKERFSRTWGDFLNMFRNKESLRAIGNSSIFDGFFKASKDYLQPILKSQAISLPVLIYLSGEERTAIIVGIVYFFLYILTSFASRSAGKFSEKIDFRRGINLTYICGALLLLFSGIFTHISMYALAIVSLIGLYIVQNLRRPLSVGYISDRISHRTMASGLSVESQMKTIVTAVVAPIIGYIADIYGIGIAFMTVSLIFILFYIPFRVPEKE